MSEIKTQSDNQWLTECVELYEGRLIRYAYRILGDLDLAREATQEAFLKLVQSDRAKVHEKVSAWLYTVTRNNALQMLRKDKKLSNEEFDEAEKAGPDRLALEEIEKMEEKSRLLKYLKALKPKQQEVLLLRYQEDLSYKDISSVTGLSVTYVGVIINESMRTLRQHLSKDSYFEPLQKGALNE